MPAVVITAEPFWDELIDRVMVRAAGWDATAADLFSGAAGDPEAAEFTRRLLELVLGDEDAVTAALELKRLAPEAPATMRTPDRLLLRAGGAVSLGLPWAVMPVARRWLRDRLSHLVLATKSPAVLSEALRRHTERGVVPVVRPLGDHVLGPEAVAREVERLVAFAALPAVTRLIVDPARLVPGGSDWSADADVVDAARTLRPVLDAAAAHHTTIHLEPTSVRWARLIPAILELALADSALDRVRVGAGFLAELPESRELYSQVSRWALRRVADGGAPVEAVIGVGGVAANERVAAVRAGLPVPIVEGGEGLTSQFLGLIELALHPGRAVALRPVIATEDPLTIAATIEAAAKLGANDLFSVRLRAGVASGLASSIMGEVPEVRVCLPVTRPREYGGAIDLLVPLALEAAAQAGATQTASGRTGAGQTGATETVSDGGSAVDQSSALRAGELEFRGAAARAAGDPHPSHRTQSRSREWDPTELDSALFYRAPDEPARFDTGGLTAAVLGLTRDLTGEVELTELAPARAIPVVSASGFANEPDTDASRAENRDWARRLVALARDDVAARDELAAPGSSDRTPADHPPTDHDPADHDHLNDTVALSRAELDPERATGEALAASARWRSLGHGQRAIHLRRLALGAVAARDRLLRTLVADTGAPVPEIDAEIGRIVDAARYSGQLAEGIAAVRGATFTPDALALVTGDAWAGLAAQAEAVLAALGAGSGVLWAAPARLSGSAHALLEEWVAAGLPVGSVTLEVLTYPEALTEVAAAPGVDRAIVLGDRAAATALARRRPDLRVEGRFLARGAVIVSPTAELAQAVADVIASAFMGPVLSRANTVIVVGSVGRARRFRDALTDAVNGLRVGDTSRAAVVAGTGAAGGGDVEPCPIAIEVGPLPTLPTAGQLRALTEAERGARWALAPEKLSDDDLLWRPGVRTDAADNSTLWADSCGLPVIDLIHAHTMAEAIRHQNSAGSGAVAGLQATSGSEVAEWLESVEAATLALNRPTSDVRVERQPVGGWNDAVMGLPPLAAGPNRLVTLGSWQTRHGTPSSTLHLRGLEPEVTALIETLQPELAYAEFDELRRAALADSLTWRTTFAPDNDAPGLGVERNVLRYHPVATQIRLAEGSRAMELARVVAAALLVRAPVTVSTGEVLPGALSTFLEQRGIEVSLERDDDWLERVAVSGLGSAARLRLIGGNAVRTAEWFGGRDRVPMWAEPVTMAGPVEILSLVREQAVSARAHRHGVAVPVAGLDEPAR